VRRHRLIETFLLEHPRTRGRMHEMSEASPRRSGQSRSVWRSFWGISRGTPAGLLSGADGVLAAEDSFRSTRRRSAGGSASPTTRSGSPVLAWESATRAGRSLKVGEARDLDGVVTVEDEEGVPHSGRVFVRSPDGYLGTWFRTFASMSGCGGSLCPAWE